MISKSTHYAKQGEVQRNWVLVDADGAVQMARHPIANDPAR